MGTAEQGKRRAAPAGAARAMQGYLGPAAGLPYSSPSEQRGRETQHAGFAALQQHWLLLQERSPGHKTDARTWTLMPLKALERREWLGSYLRVTVPDRAHVTYEITAPSPCPIKDGEAVNPKLEALV